MFVYGFHNFKAATVLQVFDIDTKERIASVQTDFPIFYWTWLDQDTLGIVSDQFVCTWKYTENGSQPTVWFEKSSSLTDAQIIALSKDAYGDWGLLSGIFLRVIGILIRRYILFRIIELLALFNCITSLKMLAS